MVVFLSGAAALLLCCALLPLLMPLLRRYALARPNARSSHREPTPQGGGIAVVAAILAVCLAAAAGLFGPGFVALPPSFWLALLLLAGIGAADDIRPLPALLRLGVHAGAVVLVLWGAGAGQIFAVQAPAPAPGLWLFAILAGAWMVNLTNFMDGLDWLTVAAVVPLAAALALLAPMAGLAPADAVLAAALAGALLGFAPFNRPVARVFLGDVGSLPVGLLVFYLLYRVAEAGHPAAALILPAYSVADATLTLLRRLLNREAVWQAHRSHFYQRATDNGFTARGVSLRLLVLNIGLAGLAALTILTDSPAIDMAALLAAALLVALLLRHFIRPRERGLPVRSSA
ncbi:MAG: glycosyl transferase [Hyphomicrobiales bacterium]|nr:glycosyl transferase [Hyphomicrobiales bacterium]